MRMDLGVDDKALLDVASRPRGTRYRNTNALSSTHSSTKLGPALASAEDITEMKLDDQGAWPGAAEGDSEEDDDDDDDSASVYQDSGSTVSSPPSNIPSTSAPRSRVAGSGRNTHALTANPGGSGPMSDILGSASKNQSANSQSINGSGSGSGDPTPTGSGGKRGRKPAPAASRGAREQARKTNHSRIEKRRREKINEALATLREIVPVGIASMLQAQQSPGVSPALSAVGTAPGKKGQEKEFKLEVLERTVVFVKYLLERVNELERQIEPTLSSPQLERSNHSCKGAEVEPTVGEPGEAGISPKKRRRNENASFVAAALPSASTALPERVAKRSRQTDFQPSEFPPPGSLPGDNWPNTPESDSTIPLSPTTTLSYSTPYIGASAWGSDMSTPSTTEMNIGALPKPPGSERTSPTAANRATANTMSTESSMNHTRPKLPSIAAMLNAPLEVLSPSSLSGNGGPRVLTSLHSTSTPCSPEVHIRGPPRTSRSSSLTSPMPFQLPSSSLPGHDTVRSSLIDLLDPGAPRNFHAKRFSGRDVEDDEAAAAATLLMHFSHDRDRDSSTTNQLSPDVGKGFQKQQQQQQPYAKAQTPGSILGLRQRQ